MGGAGFKRFISKSLKRYENAATVFLRASALLRDAGGVWTLLLLSRGSRGVFQGGAHGRGLAISVDHGRTLSQSLPRACAPKRRRRGPARPDLYFLVLSGSWLRIRLSTRHLCEAALVRLALVAALLRNHSVVHPAHQVLRHPHARTARRERVLHSSRNQIQSPVTCAREASPKKNRAPSMAALLLKRTNFRVQRFLENPGKNGFAEKGILGPNLALLIGI